MIRHNLLLIFRTFRKSRSIFLINVLGLTSGLACTLMIYMWVQSEMSVDQHLPMKDRFYHVWENRIKADGIWTSRNTAGPMAAAMKEDFPEVEETCRTRGAGVVMSVNEKVINAFGCFADPSLFRLFGYTPVAGDPGKVIQDRSSVVITESLARSLFTNTDAALGQEILINQKTPFIVNAVIRDAPDNSSMQFQFVIPFAVFEAENDYLSNWGSTALSTFVLLKDGTSAEGLNKKLEGYVGGKMNDPSNYRTAFLKKVSDIYLHSDYQDGKLVGGRITSVKLFSLIAVFILVIACINFMNLSTARASYRLKEVGIKKAVGATRKSLVWQYVGESMVISFLSTALALLIVDLILPVFNVITEKHLILNFDKEFLLLLLSTAVGTGLLAGSYPALYISGFRTITVLRGKTGNRVSEIWLRQGMVGFQFAVSVVLIVSVVVVYKQMSFIQSANLGYQKDNILFSTKSGALWDGSKASTLLHELRAIPGVQMAAMSAHDMTGHNSGTWGIEWPGKNPDDHTEFEHIAVDAGTLPLLDIKLVSGRHFKSGTLADTAGLIINESGIRFMGLQNPVGARVKLWGKDREIIGVCKDFHYESLHENFKPLLFRFSPEEAYYFMIKLRDGDPRETIAGIQQAFERINPGFPFDYRFLDENFDILYKSEQRVAVLSRYFAALAIIISCLGLFALASYTAERRVKEIGIRKVLGSSEFGIIYLLSMDFTRIVIIAVVIALPVSYIITGSWLDRFAFRTALHPGYFFGAGLIALLIAWLTVGMQAFRAARINPARCLRDD